MGGFEKNASIPFRLGAGRETTLNAILGPKAVARLREKFPAPSDQELFASLRELVRYLYLAAHSPTTLFFPGSRLIDDLWHALIVETAEYRALCNALRPGVFLDHSGMKFHDYADLGDEKRIHEEQSSWLASYVANFGHFDEAAFACLNQLQEMSQRTGADLARLNAFADLLIEASKPADEKMDFTAFVDNVVRPNSIALDRDAGLVKDAIHMMVNGLRDERGQFRLSCAQTEELFSASTALTFTLWQHLAAVERLEGLPEWQEKNSDFWGEFSSGRKLCGLATTNLGRPGGAGVTAIEHADQFVLNGTAPWVCGLGLFDSVLVGFETGDSLVFALMDAPSRAQENLSTRLLKLACMNGAATYELGFKDFALAKSSIVSRREKAGAQVRPRPSAIVIPELGVGVAALRACAQLVAESTHPRHVLAREALAELNARLVKIRALRDQNEPMEVLVPLRDEFNRDAVRLLTLALGAASLLEGSLPSRLQNELLLLDSAIQSPETLKRKIKLAAVQKPL